MREGEKHADDYSGGRTNLSKNIGKEAWLPIALLAPDAGAKGGGDEFSAMGASR